MTNTSIDAHEKAETRKDKKTETLVKLNKTHSPSLKPLPGSPARRRRQRQAPPPLSTPPPARTRSGRAWLKKKCQSCMGNQSGECG